MSPTGLQYTANNNGPSTDPCGTQGSVLGFGNDNPLDLLEMF